MASEWYNLTFWVLKKKLKNNLSDLGKCVETFCLLLFVSVFLIFTLFNCCRACLPLCSFFKQQGNSLECRSLLPSAEMNDLTTIDFRPKKKKKLIFCTPLLFHMQLTGNTKTHTDSVVCEDCVLILSDSSINKMCSTLRKLHFPSQPPSCFFICTASERADQWLHSFQVNLGSVLDMAISLHTSFPSVSPTGEKTEGERKE